MRLDLDTEIRYPDGQRAGFLRKIVLDEGNEVSEVVMATDGIVSRQLIVPVHLLSEGDGGVTYLNIEPEEENTLHEYTEERLPAMADGWEFANTPTAIGEVFPATMYEPIIPIMEVGNLPEGSFSLTQGTEVWCMDERWGVVDEVLVGDDGHAQSFVGRPDDMEEPSRIIPMELVTDANSSQVVLNCTLADLPTYTQEVSGEQKEPELR